MTHLVQLKKVAKFYGPKLVFKNISVALDPSTITLVAGPNGAGKSTLLKIIAGLSRHDQGEVVRNLGDGDIGYLGHQTFLYPELTALENLQFWARMYHLNGSEDELNRILERVELVHAARERARTFSRGMAQRLNLARIFMLQPALLLLDEPGTGLDVRSESILRREITTARDRGAALVWVSHQVERDKCIADQVLAIKNRTCEYVGAAADYELEVTTC